MSEAHVRLSDDELKVCDNVLAKCIESHKHHDGICALRFVALDALPRLLAEVRHYRECERKVRELQKDAKI